MTGNKVVTSIQINCWQIMTDLPNALLDFKELLGKTVE